MLEPSRTTDPRTFRSDQGKRDDLPASLVCQSGWLEKMIDFILWVWVPSPAERRDLADHLNACHKCRIAGLLLLDQLMKMGMITDPQMLRSIEAIACYLRQVEQIETEEVVMNRTIPAFVASLSQVGFQQAQNEHAAFVAHLARCTRCYEETLLTYRLYAEDDATGVIDELERVVADPRQTIPVFPEGKGILPFSPHPREPRAEKKPSGERTG
jgi:hypothetical protein